MQSCSPYILHILSIRFYYLTSSTSSSLTTGANNMFAYFQAKPFPCICKSLKVLICNYIIIFFFSLCLLDKIYTKCGRRTTPTMMIGSAAVFIDCDEAWKLLLVTRKGSLYVWDLFHRKCLFHDSLASLITSDLSNTKDASK